MHALEQLFLKGEELEKDTADDTVCINVRSLLGTIKHFVEPQSKNLGP